MNAPAVEIRHVAGNAQLDPEGARIVGMAAVFGRLSRDLGGFVEEVAPTAFNRSHGQGWPDVLARYNHEPNMLLGTTGAGTLSLTITAAGLAYDVAPPHHRADVVELLQRGDVRRSSFAFRAIEDDWGLTDQGYPKRTLISVQLVDIAPVSEVAAYPDATAGLRSLALRADCDMGEVRRLAAERNLHTLWGHSSRPAPPPGPLLGAAARTRILARARALPIGEG